MRKATLATLCILGLALTLGAFAQDQPDTERSLLKELEKHIGRGLVKDGRAAKADVNWLLPQSCPPFYLRDEGGRIIDPTIEPDVSAAVSIKQTCMKCKETHDPNVVMNGYHFQMGADELYPKTEPGEPAPLSLGPGMYGHWNILHQRQLAPKRFAEPGEVDLTSYEWVTQFGVRAPGGGPGEYDRAGRRYDVTQASEPLMAEYQYDGDYWQAKWHESGVLEADCLICHLDGYDYSLRAQQIKKLNYRWASVEAAGFGVVDGSVKDGEIPQVRYNVNLFGPDGKVQLHIRRPTDRACMSCHTMDSVQKRGTAWHNQFVQDVHSEQGLACTDCHTSDIRHNFAKGFSSSEHVRDDLDGTMLSCKGCHYDTEEKGAPAYEHKGLPPIHLERISCEACHITKRPFLSARVVDSLTGKVIMLPNPLPGDREFQPFFGAEWGTLGYAEGATLDLFPRETLEAAAAFTVAADSPWREHFMDGETCRLPEGAFTVGDFVKGDAEVALVDSDDKRMLMLLALTEIAGKDEDSIIAVQFRGTANRFIKDKLVALDINLQPRRVGQISEYPVSRMWQTVDGQEVIKPMGYQVGAFWAYEEKGEIRPVFPRDMQAAWDLLQAVNAPRPPDIGKEGDEAFQYRLYAAIPLSGEEPAALPNPGDVEFKAYRSALLTRMKQYGGEEWTTLGNVYDDNSDMWAEVNTRQEMGAMGWALASTMKRLEKPTLYYIKGASAYRVDVTATLNPYEIDYEQSEVIGAEEDFFAVLKYRWNPKKSSWSLVDARPMRLPSWKVEDVDVAANPQIAALAQVLPWTISHGVEPSTQALGANGCTDCHSTDAEFFRASVLVDPFDEEGVPVTTPAYDLLGYTPDSLQAAAWREGILKPITPWVVLLVIAAILIHFALLGIKQRNPKPYVPDIVRFSFIERMGHLVIMASVTYLAVTGFCFLLGENDPLGEWSRTIHALVGYVAAAGMAVVFLRWAPTALPQKGDIKWLLHMGGYLGGKEHYPAHKFNAGQKILFWKAVVFMAVLAVTGIMMALNRDQRFPLQQWVYFIHDLAALFMILLLIGHIYLAVLVNPHSVRSLFGGVVSSVWAKEHHPDWEQPKPIVEE